MSGALPGIEDKTLPNGSLPRKARLMDEIVFTFGWKTQQPAELRREHGTYPVWCRERSAKPRAVRIDGAGRPPGEWQRYDRSPLYRRLCARDGCCDTLRTRSSGQSTS